MEQAAAWVWEYGRNQTLKAGAPRSVHAASLPRHPPACCPPLACRVCAHLRSRGGGGAGDSGPGQQDVARHEAHRQGGPAPHPA